MEKKPYIWTPGTGPSRSAIDRIRAHAQKPAKPMGEAWFMGEERRLYTELEPANAVRDLELVDLTEVLYEIASGTSAFGHLDEWDEWFAYLLPDFIERSSETVYFDTTVFQSIVTSFMAIYWKGIDESYTGFRADIFATLSNTIMDQKFWSIDEDPARPLFLDLKEDGMGDLKLFWGSGQADPNVSAALFFCLKYLRTDELPTWIDSVVGIKHPLWQGSLMIWFVGMLDYLKQGRMFPNDVEAAKPELQWDNSHVLGSSENADSSAWPGYNLNKDFLPEENLRIFFERMRTHYSKEKVLELEEAFSKDEHLAAATRRLPKHLFARLGE